MIIKKGLLRHLTVHVTPSETPVNITLEYNCIEQRHVYDLHIVSFPLGRALPDILGFLQI